MEIGDLLTISQHEKLSSMEIICQTPEMLPMENIYMSKAMKD